MALHLYVMSDLILYASKLFPTILCSNLAIPVIASIVLTI
jgi:hypothetical protein